LQRSLGDDNVLLVKFAENGNVRNLRTSVEEANSLYGKFGKEGINVGLRLYRFFGNSASCVSFTLFLFSCFFTVGMILKSVVYLINM